MKTIKRNPDWPSWAKYYAVNNDGLAKVYKRKPSSSVYPDGWSVGGINKAKAVGQVEAPFSWRFELYLIED